MFNILKKELLETFRDQRTLLLTVLLPLILMSALVFFYERMMAPADDETYRVAVAPAQHALVAQLFSDVDTIELIARDDVQQAVEQGKDVAGLVVADDFEAQLAAGGTPVVRVFSDEYSENGMMAMTAIDIALTQYRDQLVAQRLAMQQMETSVLTPFNVEKVQVVEGDAAVQMISFLVPLMLLIAVGVGITSAAADMVAGEKERRTMEALLMTPVNRTSLLLAKWITLILLATATGIFTLAVVFIEVYFFTTELKAGLTLDSGVWQISIASLLIIISFSALMAAALLVTSIYGKTVKEAQSYATPIIMIGILPAMFVMSIGINELTAKHFVMPILNMFTIFKELFAGVVNVEHIVLTIGVNVVLALLIFAVGRILFTKDKWVLS